MSHRRPPSTFLALVSTVAVLGACATPVLEPEPLRSPSGPLGLDEAVELALANHPDVRIALEQVELAAAELDEAESSFWPNLTLGAGFSRTDRPSVAFGSILDQGEFQPTLDFNDPGATSNFRPSAGAALTLYDGGRRRARSRAAAAGVAASEAAREAVRGRVALETARAVLAVHRAELVAGRLRLELEAPRELFELAAAERDAGARLDREVDRAARDLELAEVAAAEAEDGIELALSALRRLLGLGLDEPFELTPVEFEERYPLEPLDRLAARALVERPELRRAAARVEQALANVDGVEAGYFPELSISGELGFASSDLAFESANWLLGAGLIESVTEALRTPHRVRGAAARLRIEHERARAERLTVEHEVQAAWLDAAAVERALAAAETELVRVARDLERTRAELEMGAASREQAIVSELQARRRESEVDARRLERTLARIALEHAVGAFPAPTPGPHEEAAP